LIKDEENLAVECIKRMADTKTTLQKNRMLLIKYVNNFTLTLMLLYNKTKQVNEQN